MRNAVVTLQEALSHITDGMTVMTGGFMGVGAPDLLIDGLVEKGIKNLTLISTDTASQGLGASKLIAVHAVRRLIASHIGTNPETGRQMSAGELEVELVPQGSLAERIRARGAGLGAVVTPTGLGTEVEARCATIEIDGRTFLLEKPLAADVALIRGSIVDKAGNVYFAGTTQNFNPLMATAADVVIVEAERLVEIGELDPALVMTPGIYVDYIVEVPAHG